MEEVNKTKDAAVADNSKAQQKLAAAKEETMRAKDECKRLSTAVEVCSDTPLFRFLFHKTTPFFVEGEQSGLCGGRRLDGRACRVERSAAEGAGRRCGLTRHRAGSEGRNQVAAGIDGLSLGPPTPHPN